MISPGKYAGDADRSNEWRTTAFGVADFLHLAATPTFALLAVVTAISGSGPMTCMEMAGASLLDSMGFMYLLMAVFHAGPWMKAGEFFSMRSGQQTSR